MYVNYIKPSRVLIGVERLDCLLLKSVTLLKCQKMEILRVCDRPRLSNDLISVKVGAIRLLEVWVGVSNRF